MKFVWAVTVSAIALSAASSKTSDPSVKWTIYPGYTTTSSSLWNIVQACDPTASASCTASAILSDGGGDYMNGVNGVTNSVIHLISGSYDATLGFNNGSSRYVQVDLRNKLVAGTAASQPTWVNSVISGAGLFNVRDALFVDTALGDTNEYERTHQFGSQLPVNSTKGSYHIRMDSAAPVPDDYPSGEFGLITGFNDPYQTALVRVHHCPDTTVSNAGLSAMCPANHKESWYVCPDPGPQGTGTTTTLPTTGLSATQVGSLLYVPNSGPIQVLGEYSVPFFVKIELQ